MLKRVLSFMLAIVLILSLLPTTIFAADEVESGTCGDNLTWVLDSEGVLTISGTGEMKAKPWDDMGSSIKEVVIEDGVTSICNFAFQGFYNLMSITIPNSVTSIGIEAFNNCQSLTNITIPNGVTSIGQYTFYNCYNLMSITIPNSVTSIGDQAFMNCKSFTSITIPNSVTSIGAECFACCTSLTSITIPDSVTSIGAWAFYYCTSLTSITIPDSMTDIGDSAFRDTNLTDVYYNGTEAEWNNISIDTNNEDLTNANIHYNNTLSGTCGDNLTWVLDSDGVLTISGTGEMKYTSNVPWRDMRSSIKEVVIEDGVTSIYGSAFSDCTSLTSITIPNSVTSIGAWAFSGCTSLTSITIPDSVTSIGTRAFSYCKSLTNITIPNNVTSIGMEAFYYCTSLTNITIPNSVTSIGDQAFMNCTSLTSITIPNSVTSIGVELFSCCSSLTSITIPDSVTSIGAWAFSYCKSLTSITIPDSVTDIGDSAFCDSSLTDVYYIGTEAEWNAISIASDNEELTNATIHYGYNTYSAYISSASSSVVMGDTISVSVNVENDDITDFNAAELTVSYSDNLIFDESASSLSGATATAENGIVKIVDNGESETLGTSVYTLAFTANSAGGATVTLVSAAFGTSEEAETEDLKTAVCDTTPLSFTIRKASHVVTLPANGIFTGNETVEDGAGYTFSVEATTGAYYDYQNVTATMDGETVPVIDNGDGTWTIENVTGELVISATRTPKQYTVTITGETANDDGTTATYGTDYSFTLPETIEAGLEEGYSYALTSITIGGIAYSGYQSSNRVYTIPGADITGDIIITITETVLDADKFQVSVSGNGAGAAVGTFPATVEKNDNFTLMLDPEDGYEYTVSAGDYSVSVNGNNYTVEDITTDVTFEITRSVIVTDVTVSEYVSLNGTNMWLIKNKTTKLENKVYTYLGQNMYWSDTYNAYCTLIVSDNMPNPTADDFTIISGTAQTINYDKDVNMTGVVDANDAQLVYNIYNVQYSDFTANVPIEKFLRADVNGDGVVNTADASAIVSFLLA